MSGRERRRRKKKSNVVVVDFLPIHFFLFLSSFWKLDKFAWKQTERHRDKQSLKKNDPSSDRTELMLPRTYKRISLARARYLLVNTIGLNESSRTRVAADKILSQGAIFPSRIYFLGLGNIFPGSYFAQILTHEFTGSRRQRKK